MKREKRTNFFLETVTTLTAVRSQNLDADLFPIELRFVRVGKRSGRDCLPPVRDPLTRNEVGSRQNLTIAADALKSA